MSVLSPAEPARVPAGAAALRRPLLVGAGVAVATALVALRDPHVPWSYGICPFHAATGLWCPVCGGLRATYDLAHLHVAAAWGENPLWVVVAPLLLAWWLLAMVRRSRGLPARPVPVWTGIAGLAVLVVFGVLRNLPPFAWMAP